MRLDFPSYSYGIAEDLELLVPHLTSFEIYKVINGAFYLVCQVVHITSDSKTQKNFTTEYTEFHGVLR